MLARISVVIPNWNGEERLARLLESLEQQTERACEVLVIDNASGDQSRQTAHARGASWIPLDRNHGFARAVNTGITHATGDAIAILNNDITVAPDFLERLGGALNEHAFATPRILMASDPTRLDGTFDLTSRGFCSWRAGHGLAANATVWNCPRVIASAPMTACLFRRSVFDQVGLLDEQFGSYLEDVDFGLRCALKGVRGYFEPAAVAWHEGSATLGGEWNAASVKWIARNQVVLSKKYGSSHSWPTLTGQFLWGLAALKRGVSRAWIQGKIEGYCLDVKILEGLARMTEHGGVSTPRVSDELSGRPGRLQAFEKGQLKEILRSQEQEIRSLLSESASHQLYWSAYWALTGNRNNVTRIGILIVTHNSARHIGACLDSVNRLRGPQDIVLVIDNASNDDVASVVQKSARFIQNKHNAGFAGAVNQGFQTLQGEVDAVLLLNPDVILRSFQSDHPSTGDHRRSNANTPLQQLSAACHDSGLACGSLVDAEGQAQIGFSFRRFPTPLTLLFETIGLNRLWQSNPVNRRYRCLDADHQKLQQVEQPAGAMLMIRKDIWVRLQGFDEQFHPVWFEDVDFCRRAALAGCRATYVPSVEGIHEGGHSVLQIPNRHRSGYWYASLLRYSRKHHGRVGRGLVAGGVAAAALVRAAIAVLGLHEGSRKVAAMNLMIARTALVYPQVKPAQCECREIECAHAADVRSRVSDEGLTSNENTERTLKRLHAR